MNKIEQIIEESIVALVGGEEGLNKQIDKLLNKHAEKLHFIPLKYRVLGGFLQALNIKFGDFIEKLLDTIIKEESALSVVSEVSGRNLTLELEENCEEIIDEYINNPLRERREILRQLPERLSKLFNKIFYYQQLYSEKLNKKPLDVNVLFKAKDNVSYYVEIKYNNDHDTGKFQDINRKFLKTYAGLVRQLNFKSVDEFKPLLYYFNPTIRYDPNPYLRENVEILRGKDFFQKFGTTTTYNQIEEILVGLEEKFENKFDEFRERIFEKVKGKLKQEKLQNVFV